MHHIHSATHSKHKHPKPTGIIQIQHLSIADVPTLVNCTYCNKTGKTFIEPVVCTNTYLCSLILLATTCVCCFLPFLTSNCKDKEHRCRHCKMPLGINEYKLCWKGEEAGRIFQDICLKIIYWGTFVVLKFYILQKRMEKNNYLYHSCNYWNKNYYMNF